MKPSINPAVLKIALILSGVVCLVAMPFVPAEYRLYVASAGTGLLGWGKTAPGDISVTTHTDDLR